MPKATQGSVASLWRYPVKSMLGEELSAVEVTSARNWPQAWKGRDGRLWFATVKGLVMRDPRHVVVNRLPPEVRITAVQPRLDQDGAFHVGVLVEARRAEDVDEFVEALDKNGVSGQTVAT